MWNISTTAATTSTNPYPLNHPMYSWPNSSYVYVPQAQLTDVLKQLEELKIMVKGIARPALGVDDALDIATVEELVRALAKRCSVDVVDD